MILALGGEAVGAVQVAGMGHVQTQSLDHAGSPLLQRTGHGLEGIRREQLTGLFQLSDLVIALLDLLHRHIRIGGRDLLYRGRVLVRRDQVIRDIIDHMDRAGANVQHDIVTAEFILMDHESSPLIWLF